MRPSAVHSNRELFLAFLVVVLITLVYLFVVVSWVEIPTASDFFGHSLGVLGFVLMLLTETLYSWRKRRRTARWGRMASWLQFHIFTGLVGPYLVLLHSSWKFHGLAGVTTLLTLAVVASGFVGRYIYTAVPRSADGVEMEAGALRDEITALQAEIEARQSQGGQPSARSGAARQATRQAAQELKWRIRRLKTLQRQLRSLAAARRLLAIWHTVHIPIGLALFTAAFIHLAGAIYYATLLR